MTNILAIDTTLGACSTAIRMSGELIGSNREIRMRGHVERLLPMIDELLNDSSIGIKDMDYIAMTRGPGTFAGVRIGLAAAKGLALALNIPIIAISSLEALAFDFAQTNIDFVGDIAVMIDARRGEVYMQSFQIQSGDIIPVDKPISSAIVDAQSTIAAGVSDIIGSACPFFTGTDFTLHEEAIHPDAVTIAQYAELNICNAMASDDVEPLYLRAPDAVKPVPFSVVVTDED